jgi:glycosyltransferase involved in cell wall biosynthesis
MAARRLILDLQGAQDVENGDRGIGRYVIEHARALLGRADAVAGLLLNPQLPFPGHLPAELLDSPLLRWNTAEEMQRIVADGPVAYYLMSPFEFGSPGPVAIPQHVVREDTPLLATLFDLIPLNDPDRYLSAPRLQRYQQRLSLLRTCDLVLAISEHSRLDGIRRGGLSGSRVVTIGGAAADAFRPATANEDATAEVRRTVTSIRLPYVFCVSGGDERKNTERLIRAWARLPGAIRNAHQLVISCALDPMLRRDWLDRAREAGVGDGEIVLTGFVSDELLVRLYQASELVVMPSLYEGYGLPVAEAIACDRPVVMSNATSLPEVLGVDEATFDPYDEAQIARAIERGLTDLPFRTRLLSAARAAAPRHRWKFVADRTLDALDKLPTPRTSRRNGGHARRMRVAIVGPMPPHRSGIADFNARLVAPLATLCDLDVLSPAPPIPRPGSCEGARHLPVRALGRSVAPGDYDAIVYTAGNSPHHFEAFEALQRHHGIVWLHDVRMVGFWRTYTTDRLADPVAFMRERLSESYGPRVPRMDLVANPFEHEWHRRHGLFMTRDWVRPANGLLVNSAFAERLLILDQGPAGPLPPVQRLFVPLPPPHGDPNVQRDTDPPVVATFGVVDPVKQPRRLIEAMAATSARLRARLVFVGPVGEDPQREIEAHAEALGVADRVEFTGDVAEDDYWSWLRRATVAVQLRGIINGESSATICDCLAAGLPVITNMVNAAEEFPPEAVVAVDYALADDELEQRIVELVEDATAPERMRRPVAELARWSTYEVLAERFLTAVDRLISAQPNRGTRRSGVNAEGL